MENKKDELSIFAGNLLKEKGLDNIDPEIFVQLRQDLRDRLEDRINVAIAGNIPPEKLSFFEKLLDQSNEEEIQAFCKRNIYNIEEITANELAEFRKTYLNS